MLKLLSRALAPIEEAYDKTKTGLKWRYGLWGHLRVRPYIGYGTPDEIHVIGRVLDGEHVPIGMTDSVWTNIGRTLRRIESDEVRGATVRLRDGETVLDTRTDDDGYFSFTYVPMAPAQPWHHVHLDLLDPIPEDPVEASASAAVLIPHASARIAVISDMDDTVVKTGATNKLVYARTVLLNNAHSRIPFKGVAAFYQALQRGPAGDQQNPVFYVSSSPWNLFGQFRGFLRHRGIPEGPIFLKDFGIDEDKFIKSGHRSHKVDYIRTLLDTYPDLDFVLVGDSGQEDAEIYRRIAHERPGRLRAIYIRDVTDEARDQKVRAIAGEVEALGVPMRLVKDSAEAARHAAEIGIVAEGAVREVEADAANEEAHDPAWWERALG